MNAETMVVTLTVADLERIIERAAARGISSATPEPLVYFTLEQTAELIGFDPKTVMSHVKSGALVGSKVGNGWRFARSDIERFMKANRYVKKAG